jgi:hypothetical protein
MCKVPNIYIFLVPPVEEKTYYFLKTIIPPVLVRRGER